MARKPMGMPPGVEVRGEAIRIRFTWNGDRCSETLTYPPNQTGIAQASRLRDQVISLTKLGLLDETKYTELFPNSVRASIPVTTDFGAYAQLWLNSRSIVKGTRNNYKAILNKWLMPYIATKPLTTLTPHYLRQLFSEIPWGTQQIKTNAMIKLSSIFNGAVSDGLLIKNPMDGLELPKRTKKKIDPFTQAEADQIIDHLYKQERWSLRIYGAFFQFFFYTGMRPGEIMALRWDEVDIQKKVAYVCRIVADRKIEERTKTNQPRHVLLNTKALAALAFASTYCKERANLKRGHNTYPYCFPPAQGGVFMSVSNMLHTRWREMLTTLGIKYRPPYNARHTYATMCLMAGMNPAFIASQLGHSVDMLLSTYAQWLNNEGDWDQLNKLQLGPNLPHNSS